MAYERGVYVKEMSSFSNITTITESTLPYFVGVAPIYTLSEDQQLAVYQTPVLINSLEEFKATFGWAKVEGSDTLQPHIFSLCEAAEVYFGLYGCSPAFFCAIGYDPTAATIVRTVEDVVDEDTGEMILNAGDWLAQTWTLVVTTAEEDPEERQTLVEGVDYRLSFRNGMWILTLIGTSTLASPGDTLIAKFSASAAFISADQYIQGIDKIDYVYAEHAKIPNMIVCPGGSELPTVALAMQTKAEGYNDGRLRALAVVDVPVSGSDAITSRQNLQGWKLNQGLTSPSVVVCWPKVTIAGTVYSMSTHFAAMSAMTDRDNGDLPFVSASSKSARFVGTVVNQSGNWVRKPINDADARIINSYGIITGKRVVNNMALYGNETAAFSDPSTLDAMKRFYCVRRTFIHIANNLWQNYLTRIDGPINKNWVQSVVQAANQFLDSMRASGALLKGEVRFSREKNPDTALSQGKVVLDVVITPPSPANVIQFDVAYDSSGMEVLFEQ